MAHLTRPGCPRSSQITVKRPFGASPRPLHCTEVSRERVLWVQRIFKAWKGKYEAISSDETPQRQRGLQQKPREARSRQHRDEAQNPGSADAREQEKGSRARSQDRSRGGSEGACDPRRWGRTSRCDTGPKGPEGANTEAALPDSTRTGAGGGRSAAWKSGRRLGGDPGESGAHADHTAVVTL